MVHVSARHGALPLGPVVAGLPLGRELLAGPGGACVVGTRLVGGVYAAHAVGAIAGALALSLIAIPQLGTLWSERLLIGLFVLSTTAAPVPSYWLKREEVGWDLGGGLACALVLAAVLGQKLTPIAAATCLTRVSPDGLDEW